MMNPTIRKLLAEAVGTFCLVFAGTSALVVNDTTGGAITTLGVAVVFGLVVMTMVYAVGEVSGAHINPAVTIGFALAGRFPLRDVPGYIAFQTAGAIVASLLVLLLFPDATGLGETVPAGSWSQSFGLEIVLTAMLVFVILSVATGSKEQGLMAGIAIGGTVGLAAIFGGPVSGASMNPARSCGPAIVAGSFTNLWIYLTAPMIGSVVAVVFWRLTARPHAPR